MPQLEEFCYQDGKRLRCGYTTGSCAAAAAKAAATMLLLGHRVSKVTLETPAGITLELPVENAQWDASHASCGVRKDAGDDPDVTHGLLIQAQVSFMPGEGIVLDGGPGVGRVTQPGLECPVGQAAINRVPRQMILDAVAEVAAPLELSCGLRVLICVPQGEAVAKRTFNPRLGIVGGISILGTSGIVKPMSEEALAESICLEIRQRAAKGERELLLAPGNYGGDFLSHTLGIPMGRAVFFSNFLGQALDCARQCGILRILLVGHIGKLIKVAAGVMNTHSHWADSRLEVLTAHAAMAGIDACTARQLMGCATTDAALKILEEKKLLRAVMESVMERISFHLAQRVGQEFPIEAIVFSKEWGILGVTPGARELAEHFQ